MDTLLKALEDLRESTKTLEYVVWAGSHNTRLKRRDAIQAWIDAKNNVLQELTKYNLSQG